MRPLRYAAMFGMTGLLCAAARGWAAEQSAAEPSPAVEALLKELTGQAPAVQRTPGAWQSAYAQLLATLLSAQEYPDPNPVPRPRPPKGILDEIVLRAGAADIQRAALVRAMLDYLAKTDSLNDRIFLLRQLAVVGRDDALPALEKFLKDPSAPIRQYALRALANNPSAAAGQALVVMVVSEATAPEDRLAAVNALGQRRESAAAGTLAGLLSSADEKLSAAAVMALGSIGSPEAAKALSDARAKLSGKPAAEFDHAYLLCADRLRAKGQKDAAQPLYKAVYQTSREPYVRMAALRGLVLTAAEQSVPLVIEALKSDNARVQAQAARLVLEIPGDAAGAKFRAALPQLPAPAQALLTDALAEHDRSKSRARP